MEDKNLDKEDKANIEESIVKIIIDLINKVIEEADVKLKDIEFIGIASPGTIKYNNPQI